MQLHLVEQKQEMMEANEVAFSGTQHASRCVLWIPPSHPQRGTNEVLLGDALAYLSGVKCP